MGFRHILVPIALLMGLAGLPFVPVDLLRYEREALEQFEPWRLFTAQWLSLGLVHALLNGVALVLLWELARHQMRARQWWLVLVVTGFAVHLGLWLFSPGIDWAVGLSGPLHGLAVLVIATCQRLHWQLRGLALAALGAKVLAEQFDLITLTDASWIGGSVLVEAHLYGWLTGMALLILYGSLGQTPSPTSRSDTSH